MRKANLALATLLVFVAMPLFAQNPGWGAGGRGGNGAARVQREVTRLTTLLDLTPGQQTQLTALLTSNSSKDQPLMQSRFKAERALRTAEDNNDSAGIQAAHQQLTAVDTQMAANRAAFNTSLAGILTADQMTKYNTLRQPGGGFGLARPGASGVGANSSN
jgi:Spy/CpxP family protein refolding chaperone